MKKETYDITGMSCAACSARIEKGISGMEGMQQCSVNLLKNSMTVSYDEAKLDSGKIVHQVEDIGYGASLHQTQGSKTTGASGRGKNGATDAAAAAAKQMLLSMIRDLYDNSIVAYKTASRQTVNLVLDTIRLAMKKEKKRVAAELQLHSDQGLSLIHI